MSAGRETIRLTAGQALVRWLAQQWSERDGRRQRVIPAIFGIFGHGNALGLGQALVQEGAELPLYQPKNEQGMVHTAIGYAKASRRLQTLACTASIGPGATNMLTGAATATVNRMPVLLLPADTFATRRQGPVLQQLERPGERDVSVNDAFRPLSRFFDRISRPEQLLDCLPEAMRVLLDPAETGAVTVAMHQDVLGEAFDYPGRFFAERTWTLARRPPAREELAAAVELLRGSRSPLIVAGGGVHHSEAERALQAFAEQAGIPVAETSAGKGAMAGCRLGVGGIGVNGTRAANRLAADSDVVLCVGTRLTDFTTGSRSLFQHPDVRFVGLNVCAADAHKHSAAPLVADARRALEALTAAGVRPRGDRREAARREVERWRAALDADRAAGSGLLTQSQVYAEVNRAARTGDWVVAAAGWAPGDLLKSWDVVPGSRAHIEFGFSCMGHEIPAALGIRMQDAGAGEIYVVIGDGTYLMGASELATAVQEELKIVVIVLDNGGFGSIDALARAGTGVSVGNRFVMRSTGAPLAVDFVANATGLGCLAERATDAQALRAALGRARSAAGPVVIACPTDPDRPLLDGGAFWDLGLPEVAEDETTQRLGSEHRERARARQRHY